MQVSGGGISAYSKDSMAFNFTTSSGDSIDFSSYKESSLAQTSVKSDSGSITTTELTLSRGYEFHYKGDGIDENDMKEIKEALKKLTPDMKEFMKSSGNRDILGRELEGLASSTAEILPKLTAPDSREALKENFLSHLDDIFKMFDKSQKSYDNSQRLLDKLFSKIDGKDNSFYA
jgi:hypothetical protein